MLVPERNNLNPVNAFMKYVENYPYQLFDFNGLDNGIVLKRYSSKTKGLNNGVHASHNAYTKMIRDFLDEKYQFYENKYKSKLSGAALEREIAIELHKHVEHIRIELKKKIIKYSIKESKVRINLLPGIQKFQDIFK